MSAGLDLALQIDELVNDRERRRRLVRRESWVDPPSVTIRKAYDAKTEQMTRFLRHLRDHAGA